MLLLAGSVLSMVAFRYDKAAPILFEVSTKLRAAQDPDSAAMVDHIVRNPVYDPAYFGDTEPPGLIHSALSFEQNTMASTLRTKDKMVRKKLDQIIVAYEQHK